MTARAERDVEENPALQGLQSSLPQQRLFLLHLKTCLPLSPDHTDHPTEPPTEPPTWVEPRLAAFERYAGAGCLSTQLSTMFDLVVGKEHEIVWAHLDEPWEAVWKAEVWLSKQSPSRQRDFVAAADAVTRHASSNEEPAVSGAVSPTRCPAGFSLHAHQALFVSAKKERVCVILERSKKPRFVSKDCF